MSSTIWMSSRLMLVVALMTLAGCGGGGGSGGGGAPGLSYTNGNNLPEMTGVPALPASWTIANAATAPSFNVTVPVDSDTAGVRVSWGTVVVQTNSASFTTQATGSAALTPGAAQTATVTITPGSFVTPGNSYTVSIVLCNTAGACDIGGSGNVTWYTPMGASGTFDRIDLTGGASGGLSVNTGVAAPKMTVL